MSQFQVRTDLALEAREKFEEDNVEIKGVRVAEETREKSEIKITTMVIETENGAKAMGKPKGTYITLEAANMDCQDEDYHREISVELARIVKKLMPRKKEALSVLVAGLGNREVTPDALGPRVGDNRIWQICIWGGGSQCRQRDCPRGYGTDRDGEPGNHKGCCGRNKA